MKNPIKYLPILLCLFLLIGCGNSDQKEDNEISLGDYQETSSSPEKAEDKTTAEDIGDPMQNKGIGPVSNVETEDGIDEEMASEGAALFKNMCSACHKMDKKFIGPAVAGVTERRTHEWIMNMIINPEQMIKEDPIAKQLLIESNMAVMADQNLSEDEARNILEYFRQYDQEN